MFFAVRQYKKREFDKVEKLCVFDTSDCTVEAIFPEEIDNDYYIPIKNLSYSEGERRISETDIKETLRNFNFSSETFSFATFEDGMSIAVQGHYFVIMFDGYTCKINNILLNNKYYVLRLVYFFRFRRYIVFRFTAGYGVWYSVAIDFNSGAIVSEWSSDFEICINKLLALQIDMTMEV